MLPAVLLVGLLGEGRAARNHQRWWIVGVGLLGSLVLYGGWSWRLRAVLYGGMALLFAASALTFWAKRYPSLPLVQLTLRGMEKRHGNT